MKKYLKLMRVHHYIKNLLVFVALIFSGQLFNRQKLIAGMLAFVSFCLMSSVVYIINDIQDKEKDKGHPQKCNRPIASGAISVKKAWILAVFLLLISLLCNSISFKVSSTILLLLYLVLNLLYSFKLKNFPILDLAILVSGFLIRIMYGAVITDISVSSWLYLTVISVAFYFAIGKRRNELQSSDENTRTVLKKYSLGFLNSNMNMCLTLANVFYALWSMAKETCSNHYLVLTVPCVLLITMRYSFDIEDDASNGDPVEVLLHDKILLFMCLAYALIMFAILYL